MQREFPVDDVSLAKPSRLAESSRVARLPINEYDALMRTAPGDSPEQTQEEVNAIRDVVAAGMELLSDHDRYILEAIHSERLSIRQLAVRLGLEKSHTERLIHRAQDRLRDILTTHHAIRERIDMFDNWNDAALDAVFALSPAGQGLPDDTALSLINRKIDELRKLVHSRSADEHAMVGKLTTIGYAAACILDNMGAWSGQDMVDLLVRKQNDYGHGNINAFGLIGVVVRTSDKVARYNNLANRDALSEPRVDALVDLVGYAAIARMLDDGSFQLPLVSEPQAVVA